jgi:hypothetical protein
MKTAQLQKLPAVKRFIRQELQNKVAANKSKVTAYF